MSILHFELRINHLNFQMLQVGLLTENTQLIITNLDLHTIDLEPFRHSAANITAFKMIDENSQYIGKLKKFLNETAVSIQEDEFNVDTLVLQDALIFDGILLFAEALKNLPPELTNPFKLECGDDSTWKGGYTIANFMKNVSKKEENSSSTKIFI